MKPLESSEDGGSQSEEDYTGVDLGFAVELERYAEETNISVEDIELTLLHANQDWRNWDGGVLGGDPISLIPQALWATEVMKRSEESEGSTGMETIKSSPMDAERAKNFHCDSCGRQLAFLLQIYCPIDRIEAAFHRSIYVFVCPDRCLKSADAKEGNTQLAVKVLRMQLPRKNSYYVEKPDSVEWKQRSSRDATTTTAHRSPWRKLGEKRYLIEIEGEVEAKEGEEGGETPVGDASVQALLSDACEQRQNDRKGFEDDATLQQTDLNEITGMMQHASLKRHLVNNGTTDEVFQKFLETVNRYPEQIIRYLLWPETTDLAPLCISAAHQTTVEQFDPGNCENCGSERRFEFQIMPQLLNLVATQEEEMSLDFGTIVVYTCVKSCLSKEQQPFVQELAVVECFY